MASYFRESRNVELSLLYYLESNVPVAWQGATVVKTFKEAYAKNTVLPIVCARLAETTTERLEIGSTTLENRYLCIIDIFSRSDAQRLDMADYIKDLLKDGWVHYEHSHESGDKENLVRTASGRDFVTDFITDSKLDFGEAADERDRYRHNISIKIRRAS